MAKSTAKILPQSSFIKGGKQGARSIEIPLPFIPSPPDVDKPPGEGRGVGKGEERGAKKSQQRAWSIERSAKASLTRRAL
jgi:hypothetical protein